MTHTWVIDKSNWGFKFYFPSQKAPTHSKNLHSMMITNINLSLSASLFLYIYIFTSLSLPLSLSLPHSPSLSFSLSLLLYITLFLYVSLSLSPTFINLSNINIIVGDGSMDDLTNKEKMKTKTNWICHCFDTNQTGK